MPRFVAGAAPFDTRRYLGCLFVSEGVILFSKDYNLLVTDLQEQREQLLVRVRQAAAALKSRFKAKRVILFGSLAQTNWFAPGSDVDLAVEGLGAADYWQAWRLAEDIIEHRPVDLIEMETAKDSLRRAILRYGMEL